MRVPLEKPAATMALHVANRPAAARSGEAGAGQRMLEWLERENLFLVPLDEERRWWRYHRLFAEFLRRWAEEELRDELGELHQRAAVRFEENGFPAASVGHAAEVRDFERAARLLDEAGHSITFRPSLLLRWLAALPAAIVRFHSNLYITEAWDHPPSCANSFCRLSRARRS